MGHLAHVQRAEESLADAPEAILTPPTEHYCLQASVPLLKHLVYTNDTVSLSSPAPLPHGSHHPKSVLGAIFLDLEVL